MRVLPEGQGPYFQAVNGNARGNSTILVVDGGLLGCADKIGIEMLYKEVRQLFFNQLRTQQQTGYVAQTSVTEAARRTMAMFLVVSSWAGPADLLNRYNTFIDGVMAGLNNGTVLSPDNFASIKTSLLSEFDKPIANIAGMAGILQDVVENYDGDFNVFKERQTIIKEMTIERIKSAAARMFSSSNTRRLAVLYSPDGVNPGNPPANYQAFTGNEGTFEKRPKYSCDPSAPAPAVNATVTHLTSWSALAQQSLSQDLELL
jgi:insulysin